jgi:hypothetical protein
VYRLTWRLPLAGLVAFSHLQFSQIRGRQPYLIVRKILYVILDPNRTLKIPHCGGARERGRYWQKDITVVAIAPDGTWGVATEPTTGHAIANAIADCKKKYQSKIGCGSRITTIRGGWSIGMRCGNRSIFVAEETLAKAEQAAINREIELRQLYAPGMPLCSCHVSRPER